MFESAKSLGHHYFFEFYDCPAENLSQLEPIRHAMLTAARKAGASIVNDLFHQFSPQGVSGVVVIEESHLSIHTWPEFGYAAVDFFTCSSRTEPEMAMQYLAQFFSCANSEIKIFERGARLKQSDMTA